jgi:hypothetical protein
MPLFDLHTSAPAAAAPRCSRPGREAGLLPAKARLWRKAGWLSLALALCLASGVQAQDVSTQRLRGRVAVGGQVGSPSGLTVKLYKPTGLPIDDLLATKAIELLAEWDFEQAALHLSVINERPLQQSPLHFFIGPGIVLGAKIQNQPAKLIFGVIGNAGVNFFLERFEVFLHLTPQLNFTPGIDGFFGGGIGLRYFLGRSAPAGREQAAKRLLAF